MTTRHDKKPFEPYRLLIFRRDAEEILLRPEGALFALPQIDIPGSERIAANVNSAVKRELGLDVVSLYEVFPENPKQSGVFYYAAVSVRPREDIPAGMYWTSVGSLTADSFSRRDEFAAIATFRSGLNAPKNGLMTEPFLKPNWFVEIAAWVARSLRPSGLRLSGSFQQLNASPTFSLIRFETDGEPVWFKAVGEPNTREFHVTIALARICPEYLPKVLADNGEWNAWLAEEASGISLSSGADFRRWESAAESLAHLQILALPNVAEISSAGARDLRPKHLLSRVVPFCEFIAGRTAGADSQATPQLRNLNWRQLGAAIEDALTELERLDLPETLGHMDLNPQNIFDSAHGCIFLDWAEAFTGCPFFSFEYLLQHFRRFFPGETSLEARFRNAYVRRWQPFISHRHLETALTFSSLAALFAYASTLWVSLSMRRDSMAVPQETYLLRLARKMSRMTAQEQRVRA